MLKVIVKYKKTGFMKYLGHLEMISQIERVLRRLEIPLEFSKGYNPKPQISFAAPLAVGVSSEAEYFEVKVTREFDLDVIKNIDPSYLPEGLTFEDAIFSKEKKSIMALVKSSMYIIKAKTASQYSEDEIREKLKLFLNQDQVLWLKRRKRKKPIEKDILPLINDVLVLNTSENEIVLRVQVKTGSSGNLKPEIVLEKFCEYADINIINDYIDIERREIYTALDHKLVPIIR